MCSIIPLFGCRYKSTLSGLMFLFCNPTIKNISYLIFYLMVKVGCVVYGKGGMSCNCPTLIWLLVWSDCVPQCLYLIGTVTS